MTRGEAVGGEAGENTLEKAESRGGPCEASPERSPARAHMCSAGSRNTTRALRESQRGGSKPHLTAYTFILALRDMLGVRRLRRSIWKLESGMPGIV